MVIVGLILSSSQAALKAKSSANTNELRPSHRSSIQTLIQNLFELALGDTISVENNATWGPVARFSFYLRPVFHIHLEHILKHAIRVSNSVVLHSTLRTLLMLWRSAIISWRDVCTREVAMYLAVSESTLATRAVNEGRPSEPGAG